MRRLFYFELKKIVSRRGNQVAILLGIVLMVVCSIVLIQGESYYDGTMELNGVEAILKQKEIESGLPSELSDKFLTGLIADYQQQIAGNPDSFDFSLIKPKWNLFRLIASNYTEWNDPLDWTILNQISTDGSIHFYDRRIDKIETLLNTEYSFGNYTEAEKEYWMEKAERIHTPFQWGSTSTWKLIWTGIEMQIFLLFILSFCIAPVFAGEYQTHTDALLMTTRYGKSKAISAKIMASFVFAVLYIVLCSSVSIGIIAITLGMDGGNLPVQLMDSIIPYQWTLAKACGINLLVILVIACFLTAFSLLLSTICRSPMIVLAADVALFFGSVFLPSSKSSILWNKIAYLFPLHCFDLQSVLTAYNSYKIGGLRICYPAMIFITYIILTVICLLCTKISFQKHQIKD